MAGRPEHVTLTITGGSACEALLSGTITTVRRCSLTALLLIITHGRVLLISDPAVGSRFAHQMSPRRGVWNCIAKMVEILFDSSHLSIYPPTSTVRLVRVPRPYLQNRQERFLGNLDAP